jgi:hypothetical protein
LSHPADCVFLIPGSDLIVMAGCVLAVRLRRPGSINKRRT